ncbi:MAG: hypothetical protein QOH66_2508 [Actinomycetota bacterium]|nr:hypothetical protein [Actinomycetota bacterium]
MTPEEWTEANNRYLAASLRWARLRLMRLLPDESPAAPARPAPAPAPAPPPAAPQPRRSHFWSRREPQAQLPAPLLPPMPAQPVFVDPALDQQVQGAAAEREAAAAIDPPPALELLAARFGLSPFERDIVLLCAAMELDTGFAPLCGRIQGHGREYPTFGLALSALDNPSWDARAPERPLRYAQLIEVDHIGSAALTASPLRVSERILNFVKGMNSLDERLGALLEPVGAGQAPALSPSQQAVVEAVLARLARFGSESLLPVIQLVGTDAGSRLAVAERAAAALNRRLYRISTESLPAPGPELDGFARLLQRESLLLPVALYVEAEGAESLATDTAAAFHRFLTQPIGLAFVGVRDAALRTGGPSLSVEVAKPTPEEQLSAWASVLGLDATDSDTAHVASMLAGQFNLNLGDIQESASLALAEPAPTEPLPDRLWARCRDLTKPRLDVLAQRLDPKATWEDLVLAQEQVGLLRNIAGQVRNRHQVYEDWGFARTMNRGFGISALFAGESGTGKTMAAEVIANDLRLNLYRIDLSGVVSKYIGETEKNLRKLFDAAEQGGAILLFDEADALFGKRSEVKDAHDRYANIEVNYLLQRMEAFTGLAVLATNLKSALDPAFLRRLRFVVNFQFPGVDERKRIWQRALPPQTPTDALDFDRLAKLTLTGGTIHNIALNAAFMAARNGQLVGMSTLLNAARMELRKLDKPFNEAELR